VTELVDQMQQETVLLHDWKEMIYVLEGKIYAIIQNLLGLGEKMKSLYRGGWFPFHLCGEGYSTKSLHHSLKYCSVLLSLKHALYVY